MKWFLTPFFLTAPRRLPTFYLCRQFRFAFFGYISHVWGNLMCRLPLLFLLLVPSLATADKVDFTVRLPDGLYLLQPNYKRNVFSLLVIVEHGKLIDPYIRSNEIGAEQFYKTYAQGKTFHVYAGTQEIGVLDQLAFEYSSKCWNSDFLSEKLGTGRYVGKPLPGKYIFEFSNSPFGQNVPYDSLRVIAAPVTFGTSNSATGFQFQMDKSDVASVEKIVRRELVPHSMQRVRQILKENTVGELQESESSVSALRALDIDGNGRKDWVGIYTLRVKGNFRGFRGDVTQGDQSLEIPFILRDTGKLERTFESFPKAGVGDMTFSAVLDIDGDGLQELILQTQVYGAGEEPDSGKFIEILRRTPQGWASIYKTVTLCAQP